VNVPHHASLNPSEFTIAFWARPGSMTTWRRWMGKNLYSTDKRGWMILRYSSNYIYMEMYDVNDVPRDSIMIPYNEDEWAHFAFTYEHPYIRAFKNGQEIGVGQNVGAWTFEPSTEDLKIGRGYISSFYNGALDEIVFYKRALTSGEIRTLYNFTVGDYIDAFSIGYRTRVDIHPYFDETPWFTGFIQTLPQPGKKRPYEYTGFGFFEQLDWVTVTESYSSEDLADIVKDIIENIVAPNTQIVYNASKIISPSYTVQSIDFDHTYAKDAIQTLCDMAQGYEFGVDNSREFYFRPIETTVYHSLWKGKHFQDIDIEKNPYSVRNKLYIKIGEIQSGGSNIIGSVSDATSISTYGLREEVIDVPESLDSTDATRWANEILAGKKDPEIRARVKKLILDQTRAKIEARGKARITAHEGSEYTLYIKRVRYLITSGGILAEIDLE